MLFKKRRNTKKKYNGKQSWGSDYLQVIYNIPYEIGRSSRPTRTIMLTAVYKIGFKCDSENILRIGFAVSSPKEKTITADLGIKVASGRFEENVDLQIPVSANGYCINYPEQPWVDEHVFHQIAQYILKHAVNDKIFENSIKFGDLSYKLFNELYKSESNITHEKYYSCIICDWKGYESELLITRLSVGEMINIVYCCPRCGNSVKHETEDANLSVNKLRLSYMYHQY